MILNIQPHHAKLRLELADLRLWLVLGLLFIFAFLPMPAVWPLALSRAFSRVCLLVGLSVCLSTL